MADPMEVTIATGTTLDDNIDKDEIEIVPEIQMTSEQVNRWVGETSPVLSRMLARLKKLSPNAGPMDENQDLGAGNVGVEYLPPILYKAPEMVIGDEFVTYDVEGVYTITGPFTPTDPLLPEYFYVKISGSFVFTDVPTDEDPGDPGLGDCYVFIELPFPAWGDLDRVIGSFNFKGIAPTDTGNLDYSFNIESQVDPTYEDWYRYFGKMSFNIANVYSPLLPSETENGTRIHYEIVYKATEEIFYDLEIPTDQLISWWDTTDISTLFQDASGTTPVTASGQQVRRINDKFGTNHLSRAAGDATTARYEVNAAEYIRGLWFSTQAAQFDCTSTTGFASKTQVTMIVVIRHDGNWSISGGVGDGCLMIYQGINEIMRHAVNPNQESFRILGQGGASAFGPTPLDRSLKILEFQFDGTQAAAVDRFIGRLNGILRPPVAGSTGTTRTSLPASGTAIRGVFAPGVSGARVGSGYWIAGFFYGKLLNSTEREQILNYYMRPKLFQLPDRTLGVKAVAGFAARTAPSGTLNTQRTLAGGGDTGVFIAFHNGLVTVSNIPDEWNIVQSFSDGLTFSPLRLSTYVTNNFAPVVRSWNIEASGGSAYVWVFLRVVGGYNTITSTTGITRQDTQPPILGAQTCVNGGVRIVGGSVINTTGAMPDFSLYGYTKFYTSPSFAGLPNYYPLELWYKVLGAGAVEAAIDFTGTLGTPVNFLLFGLMFER